MHKCYKLAKNLYKLKCKWNLPLLYNSEVTVINRYTYLKAFHGQTLRVARFVVVYPPVGEYICPNFS